jgi:hypothetical protein
MMLSIADLFYSSYSSVIALLNAQASTMTLRSSFSPHDLHMAAIRTQAIFCSAEDSKEASSFWMNHCLEER